MQTKIRLNDIRSLIEKTGNEELDKAFERLSIVLEGFYVEVLLSKKNPEGTLKLLRKTLEVLLDMEEDNE